MTEFRISNWTDASDDNVGEYPTIYGIQIKEAGVWLHLGRKGEPLMYKTTESAARAIKKLEAALYEPPRYEMPRYDVALDILVRLWNMIRF